MAGRFDARTWWLESNCGYAGGNNLAMTRLFDAGCDFVLVLNADTIVTPDAPTALVQAAAQFDNAGPIGPRVARDWPGSPPSSLGERVWRPLAWLPRSVVRYRAPRQQPYRVGGVLGCAMLVSRRLYERTGGFDERYFAYYEEVDLCLRARAMGMHAMVVPAAEIAHAGHRGFGGGLTLTSAYLKTRNLWLLGRTGSSPASLSVFAVGYVSMLAVSALGYLLRGRRDVVAALSAGWRAARAGEDGAPPDWVLAQHSAPQPAARPEVSR
jgi:GT2 family glycosyltransferase